MNEHIRNGNRMIAKVERTNKTACVGAFRGVTTHFYSDEDLEPIINEFSLALADNLNTIAKRILSNRLNELGEGMINIWIHENYK